MEYRIEKVDALVHRERILSLWQENFPGLQGAQRFVWMYANNPGGVPDVWFLLTPDNQAVGMVAVCRRRFIGGGRELLAGQAMDFVVNKAHRALGPALQLQRKVLQDVREGNVDLVYSFPNKNSKQVLKRAGFTEYGIFQRWTLVLRPSYVVHKHIANALLATFIGRITDMLYQVKYLILPMKNRNATGIEAQLMGVGDAFAEIWENRDPVSTIIGERNAQYQQWRFGELSPSPACCFMVKRQTTVLGYIIFQDDNGHVTALDYMAGNQKEFNSLFMVFIYQMVMKAKMSISTNCINLLFGNNVLKELGFVKRHADDSVFVAESEVLKRQAVLSPDAFSLTIADRDV